MAREKGCDGRDVNNAEKGWCEHAFYCALVALEHFNDDKYSTNINKIIRMWGDCDTNAAIAGVILGAKIGYSKMIQETTTSNNIAIVLNSNADKKSQLTPFTIGSKEHLSSVTLQFVKTLIQFGKEPKPFVFSTNKTRNVLQNTTTPKTKTTEEKKKKRNDDNYNSDDDDNSVNDSIDVDNIVDNNEKISQNYKKTKKQL